MSLMPSTFNLSLLRMFCMAIAQFGTVSGETLDALKRRDPDLERYRTSIEQRLFVTPANCGRIMVDGESAVSVYIDASGRGFVTTTIASASLYDIDPARLATIRVRRFDAPIQRETALAVREAWECALRHIAPDNAQQNSEHAVLDGMTVEVSLTDDTGRRLEGQMPVTSKYSGPKLRCLWDVANSLLDYSKEKPRRRAQLATKVKVLASRAVKTSCAP